MQIVFLWGLLEENSKHFLFLTFNSTKICSIFSWTFYSVGSLDGMSSLTYRKIPPPIGERSNLYGLEKTFIKNWAVGKESSIFLKHSVRLSGDFLNCLLWLNVGLFNCELSVTKVSTDNIYWVRWYFRNFSCEVI